MKKAIKIVLYVLAGVVVLLLALAGFTQTQFFRDRLRAAALSNLDSLLAADVYLGPLTGNLLTGFSIDSVSVAVRGECFVAAERVDLSYNLFEIPGKNISVRSVSLVRPLIRLLRNSNGVWNFEEMIRPSPPDTVASTRFDWVIRLDRLALEHGTIILVDTAALVNPEHGPRDAATVDYHDIALSDVNMALSATFAPGEKRVDLSSLSFDMDRPPFRLRRLSGRFLVTPTESQVTDLVIVTDKSDLRLSASLSEADLLGGLSLENLRRCPIALNMRARDLDCGELKRFIPQLHFLTGPVSLAMDAGGEFGEVKLQKLDLQVGGTQLFARGTVANLHHPQNLLLNIKLTESRVYPQDPLALLPSFGLPDMSALGPVTLNLEYDGTPLDFRTKFLLETDGGSVRADAAMAIGGPATLSYKADVLVRDVDLARVVGNTALASRLNGTIRAEGQGVSLDDLQGQMTVELEPSEVRGQAAGGSRVQVTAGDKRLQGTVDLRLGDMRSSLAVELRKRSGDLPEFAISGSLSSLNLADILRDSTYDSDLNMQLEASGSGLHLNTLNGDFLFELGLSRYREYHLTGGTAHIVLDQHDSLKKQLTLESNIADFTISGAFDIEALARLIPYEVDNVRLGIGDRLAALDSTLFPDIDRTSHEQLGRELGSRPVPLHASYDLRLKNLEPLSTVTGDRVFGGSGHLYGTIAGGYQNLSLQGHLDVNEFFYGDVESGTLVEQAAVAFSINDLQPVDPLKNLGLDLDAAAQKIHIGRAAFDSLQLTTVYRQERATYLARAVVDNDLRLVTEGEATVGKDTLAFLPQHILVAYRELTWTADEGASVRITGSGLEVRSLVLRRGPESISLDGMLGTGRSLQASLEGKQIDLEALRYFVAEEELSSRQQAFQGAADVSVRASGSLDRPEFTASLTASNIAYRTVPFGELKGKCSYRDTALTVDVEVVNRGSTGSGVPELTVAGTLPLNLSLVSVESRVPERPINLTVRSDGIQIGMLDPLLPTFNNLKGRLQCDVRIVGTPQEPNYEGSLTVTECEFLFVPNNISYLFEGRFLPRGDRVQVVDATVRNVSSDERAGRKGLIHLGGDFALKDLKPTDFNLSASGRLLVVKETTRKSSLSVYGNLFVEIGPAGLHFTGTLDQSLLKGPLLIQNSSLVFPPTQASVVEESALSVPLVVVDDTSRVKQRGPQSAAARYFGPDETNGKNGNSSQDLLPTKSFLDGLRYDLAIETAGGNTEIRMIFNQATSEELVAGIEGEFSITADGKEWYGDLTVERASYNFFKRFNAGGKLRFTGDLLNPELDIKATYEGQRTLRDSTAERLEKTETVIVTLKISGTRYAPKLDISMSIDGYDYYNYTTVPTSNDVQSDAIQFIVSGAFPLTAAQKNDVASDLSTSVRSSLVSGATSLLTGTLSEFLRTQTGFISSVELDYRSRGTFGESAEIRLSGVAFNGLWRYGGRILDDPLSNANFSLLYSFGTIFNETSLRNLMFELERRVEAVTAGQTNDLKRVNSARLFYRFSF